MAKAKKSSDGPTVASGGGGADDAEASGPTAQGRPARAATKKAGGRRKKAAAAEPETAPESQRAGAVADEGDGDGDGGESDESVDGADGGEVEFGSDGDDDVIEVTGEVVDDDGTDVDEPRPAGRGSRSVPPESSADGGAALSRTDPLQAYLREVQRHSLLTPEEEKRLTTEYVETQSVKTARRLVEANLRLVVKLAYEYRRAYKNILDLIQEGNIGLMQAVKRYDPYRGVKLSSYAAWWIRAYILRFILNNWRLVKLGTTQAQRKLFFNLNKEKAKLAAMGIEPSASEIAKRLNVEEKEVVDMDRRLSSGEASLDAPVGDTDGRAVSRLEMLPSAGSGPDMAFEAVEMGQLVQERLRRFRETLKGKDVIIFDKRMAAEDPLTLQELGDQFGISRERVRQLEARLTSKLRVYLKEELGDAVS